MPFLHPPPSTLSTTSGGSGGAGATVPSAPVACIMAAAMGAGRARLPSLRGTRLAPQCSKIEAHHAVATSQRLRRPCMQIATPIQRIQETTMDTQVAKHCSHVLHPPGKSPLHESAHRFTRRVNFPRRASEKKDVTFLKK